MFFKELKITRIKLGIASVLYRITKIFYRSDKQIVNRKGINFELYLNEGIDLHTFLFGGFQEHVYKNKLIRIAPEDVIFDVGGNIGIMALFFAKQAPLGMVYSFEPTHYALGKFKRNMELNPELSRRITLTQCFVSATSEKNSNLIAYSSWPVNNDEEKHEIHRGVAKSTENVPSITLNDFAKEHAITKLDLIKIDTDGHEFQVLSGATDILKNLRPRIILEIGIYVMKERNVTFDEYYSLFQKYNYTLYTTKGKIINNLNYKKLIPEYGTIDMIAIPT